MTFFQNISDSLETETVYPEGHILFVIKQLEQKAPEPEGDSITFERWDCIRKDEIIDHICDKYTNGEKGVRNLKRCLEIIYGKINLFRLLNADSKLFDGEVSMNVEFPFEVTTQIVDKLIKEQDKKTIPFGMYM